MQPPPSTHGKRVIEIAHEKKIPIIEDSPYREIVFQGDKLPSLWMLADGKGVLTLKTLSKMLFPGMRLGWMYGELELSGVHAHPPREHAIERAVLAE